MNASPVWSQVAGDDGGRGLQAELETGRASDPTGPAWQVQVAHGPRPWTSLCLPPSPTSVKSRARQMPDNLQKMNRARFDRRGLLAWPNVHVTALLSPPIHCHICTDRGSGSSSASRRRRLLPHPDSDSKSGAADASAHHRGANECGSAHWWHQISMVASTGQTAEYGRVTASMDRMFCACRSRVF